MIQLVDPISTTGTTFGPFSWKPLLTPKLILCLHLIHNKYIQTKCYNTYAFTVCDMTGQTWGGGSKGLHGSPNGKRFTGSQDSLFLTLQIS